MAAAATTPWTAPVTLWSGGRALPPTPGVAVGGNGATTIAWYQPGLGPQAIRASRRARPAGTFGAPLTLSSFSHPALGSQVSVAAAGDGAATVGWSRDEKPNTAVVPSSGPAGAPTAIPIAGVASDPAIAVDRRGAATAAWTEYPFLGSPLSTIQVAQRAAGATTFGPPITLGAPGSTQSTLAVSIEDRAVVAWIGPDKAVWAASREPSTGWGAPVLIARGIHPSGPTVAIGDFGDVVLAWYDNGAMAASRHGNGVWDPAQRLESSRPSPPNSHPSVSVGRLGTAIVAWRQGPAPLAIRAALRIDATGPWRLRPVARTTRNLGEPAAVTAFSGDALVAWSQPTGSGAQIYARRIRPTGPLEQVSSGAGSRTAPTLGDRTGRHDHRRLGVTWSRWDHSGDPDRDPERDPPLSVDLPLALRGWPPRLGLWWFGVRPAGVSGFGFTLLGGNDGRLSALRLHV